MNASLVQNVKLHVFSPFDGLVIGYSDLQESICVVEYFVLEKAQTPQISTIDEHFTIGLHP